MYLNLKRLRQLVVWRGGGGPGVLRPATCGQLGPGPVLRCWPAYRKARQSTNPYVNPDGALARMGDVLRLMAHNHYITQAQANDAHAEAAKFNTTRPNSGTMLAPHFVMYVRDQLAQRCSGRCT